MDRIEPAVFLMPAAIIYEGARRRILLLVLKLVVRLSPKWFSLDDLTFVLFQPLQWRSLLTIWLFPHRFPHVESEENPEGVQETLEIN
jgi:hypothetical protein